jgi:hypothetical protein
MEKLLTEMRKEIMDSKYDNFILFFNEKRKQRDTEREKENGNPNKIAQIDKEILRTEKELSLCITPTLIENFVSNFSYYEKHIKEVISDLIVYIQDANRRETILTPVLVASMFEQIDGKELIPFLREIVRINAINDFFSGRELMLDAAAKKYMEEQS